MIRLLHLADVHLDAPLGGFGRHADVRRSQLLDAFRRLPETAAETGAHAVLIAGDLFDGPRPSEVVTAAVHETVRRLVDSGIHVFAVPGNHDAVSLNPSLYRDNLPGATVFESPLFESPGSVAIGDELLHVYGVAHDPAEEPDPLATFQRADQPGLHVALLHGSVPGAPHWEAGSALQLPADRLARLTVDYIALGDYHRFRPPDEFPERTPACYSGSLAAVDISEIGPKGLAIVDLEAGAAPRVRLHQTEVAQVVRLDEFDVTAHTDEGSMADAIGEALPDRCIPVVRLAGEPAVPLDADRVRTLLEERFGHATVLDDTRFYDSARVRDLALEKTVAGHVARLGLERVNRAEDDAGRRIAERGLRLALRVMKVH